MPRYRTSSYSVWRMCLIVFLALLAVLPIAIPDSTRAVTASGDLPRYIDEFTVPTPNAAPLAITVDRHGAVWFTESNVSKVGRFDPSTNSFSEYSIPGVGDMWGITIDQNGYVWFTQYSGRGSVNPGGSIMAGGQGRLGRLDAATGNVSFVDIPTVGSFPFRIIADRENRIWFTELLGNRTGVYDQTTEKLTEYEVSKGLSGPADLVFDQDGMLWFTESFDRKVVRFNPQTGELTEFSFGTQVFSPVGISIDNQGHVWVADHGGNWIAEFNPQTQTIIRYPTHMIQGDLTIPNGLLIDDEGRVWFSEHVGNAIGYFDPRSQSMIEFSIPTGPISTVLWIALAPNGDVWFTEWSSNKIGVVHADRSVPISLQSSQKQLQLEPGKEASVSIDVKTARDIGGNGVLEYSWGTYNPREVSVSFSPQNPSLVGLADVAVQAKLKISESTKSGNYTLGLGIEVGAVRVWTMVQAQVVPPTSTSSSQPLLAFVAIPILALVGLGGLLFVRRAHRKPSA